MHATLGAAELNALIEVSRTVNAHLDLDTVLESVMTVVTEVMKVQAASLVLVEEDTGDLLFHVATGQKAERVKPIRMKSNTGIVGHVVETGKPVIVNDVKGDPHFYKQVDDDTGFTTKAILCVPLATKNREWGAIEVLNKIGDELFDERDLSLCQAIANQAAIAIENAVLHQQMLRNERLAAIGQTIAGTAHCIKNVLNGIRGGSYMVDLGVQKGDPRKVSRGWEIVKKNNLFMEDLVLDMLTYSKDREPEYSETNVNEVVQAVCELMVPKAAGKGVEITCAASPELGIVEVDPQGIRRCVLNLVSNAVDACDPAARLGNSVQVSTSVLNEGTFAVRVSDNGCGITDDQKAKLFQVFFSTKGSQGTGLGLAVTHKIISEHKGRIEVDSEPGRGTTFTIVLPRVRKRS